MTSNALASTFAPTKKDPRFMRWGNTPRVRGALGEVGEVDAPTTIIPLIDQSSRVAARIFPSSRAIRTYCRRSRNEVLVGFLFLKLPTADRTGKTDRHGAAVPAGRCNATFEKTFSNARHHGEQVSIASTRRPCLFRKGPRKEAGSGLVHGGADVGDRDAGCGGRWDFHRSLSSSIVSAI